MSRLTGKTALITGAARGLGAAYVRRFVAEGARVLVTDVIDEEGRLLAEEMGADAADYLRLDVSCGESWGAAVDRCVERFGRIDILVMNAGEGGGGRAEEQTYERQVR